MEFTYIWSPEIWTFLTPKERLALVYAKLEEWNWSYSSRHMPFYMTVRLMGSGRADLPEIRSRVADILSGRVDDDSRFSENVFREVCRHRFPRLLQHPESLVGCYCDYIGLLYLIHEAQCDPETPQSEISLGMYDFDIFNIDEYGEAVSHFRF